MASLPPILEFVSLFDRRSCQGDYRKLRRQRLTPVICAKAVERFPAKGVSRFLLAETFEAQQIVIAEHCPRGECQALSQVRYRYQKNLDLNAVHERRLPVPPFRPLRGVRGTWRSHLRFAREVP